MLEIIRSFLEDCPTWGSFPLKIDGEDTAAEGVALFPRGLSGWERHQDVAGITRVQCTYRFLLRRTARRDGDGGAQWLLDLENWIRLQNESGSAPAVGDGDNRIRLENGRLKSVDRVGLSVYEAELIVEFTNLYEGE